MSKTFILAAVVGNAIAAVLATWPLGIPSAIATGFLVGYVLTDPAAQAPRSRGWQVAHAALNAACAASRVGAWPAGG